MTLFLDCVYCSVIKNFLIIQSWMSVYNWLCAYTAVELLLLILCSSIYFSCIDHLSLIKYFYNCSAQRGTQSAPVSYLTVVWWNLISVKVLWPIYWSSVYNLDNWGYILINFHANLACYLDMLLIINGSWCLEKNIFNYLFITDSI